MGFIFFRGITIYPDYAFLIRTAVQFVPLHNETKIQTHPFLIIERPSIKAPFRVRIGHGQVISPPTNITP